MEALMPIPFEGGLFFLLLFFLPRKRI